MPARGVRGYHFIEQSPSQALHSGPSGPSTRTSLCGPSRPQRGGGQAPTGPAIASIRHAWAPAKLCSRESLVRVESQRTYKDCEGSQVRGSSLQRTASLAASSSACRASGNGLRGTLRRCTLRTLHSVMRFRRTVPTTAHSACSSLHNRVRFLMCPERGPRRAQP